MKEVNLIIAAMDDEVNALLEVLDHQYKEIDIIDEHGYEFTINDQDYILFKGKIGKANTAFFLGRLFLQLNVKRVFNIGTSGGVNNSLNLYDVVIANKVGYHDVDVTMFNYKLGQMPGEDLYFECDNEFIDSKKIDSKYSIKRGLILSGDVFVNKDNYQSTNLSKFKDCLCCEMESATVGQICHDNKIPFVIIRSISDIVTKDFDLENNDNNVRASSTNSSLVLLELLK